MRTPNIAILPNHPPSDIVFHMQIQFTPQDRQQLQDFGVKIVYLFGSHAEGGASTASDIDLGIVLRDHQQLQNTMPLYLKLFALFSHYVPNSDQLDIVFIQRAPLELRYDVITHGIPLFATSDDARLDFEERTTLAYCDFQPLLRQFDRAIIENT